MIKLITLYPTPSDADHFRSYFVNKHLPLCRLIPGLNNAHYSLSPQVVEGLDRWFCLFEAEFIDRASLNAALSTPQAHAAASDIVNYSPKTPTSLIYTPQPV